MKRLMMLLAVISLVIVLAACGNKDSNEDEDSQPTEAATHQEIEFNDDEKVSDDVIVANINDVEITGKVYNSIYLQTKIQLGESGQDVSDLEKVKELVIDSLINQELIKQDAERAGIVVSEDEAIAEFEACLLYTSDAADEG